MNKANDRDQRIAEMTFASVYPHYRAKVERKGRSRKELHQVIQWLTGFDKKKLKEQVNSEGSFRKFFQQTRYPNELVDELAKGRKMEKILRTAKVDPSPCPPTGVR